MNIDTRKHNPFDFALWKSAKPGEPSWDSPWGKGRPGWHIECSAMSTCHLGNNFDIHGGGADLQFPHHENEIAQSEGATGEPFANYWMHSALLNVDGEKMSKSLGNFWTIRDVLEHYHPESIRYFLLSAHYRKPVNYSQDNLEAARARALYLHRTRAEIQGLWGTVERPEPDAGMLNELLGEFHAGMDDDFNTPVALAIVGEAARNANLLLRTKKLRKKADVLAKLAAIEDFFGVFATVTGVLSSKSGEVLEAIQALQVKQLGIDVAEVDALIQERANARAAKDWAAADAARDKLLAMKVEVLDTPEGTTWRVVSSTDEAGA